jgi:signal transduction histidine kinase
MYFEETRQKLDLNIASHIAADNECFKGDSVNTQALRNVFHNVMVINPSIEVYLLDTNGTILTYYAPYQVIKITSVPLGPVKNFISSERQNFLMGVDPKNPAKMKPFSASRVTEENEFKGYIYVILGGQEYENVAQLVFGNYIIRLGVKSMIIALITAAIVGFLAIGIITWNIRRIVRVIRDFRNGNLSARIAMTNKGELKMFADSFNDMADTIVNNLNEIKNMDENRRVLVANVSHDLRTPLAIIRGYVETILIKDSNLTFKERKNYLEIIMRNTDRLLNLVEELFELSRLESKVIEPHFEEFSFGELLQDIHQKNQVNANEKNINFLLELAENLPRVYADIGMMEKVFQNLIDNAIKFTPSGGEIKIILKRKYSNSLFAIVSDSGIGIKEEDISQIFNRYYQAKKISTGMNDGAGLGLSIVKRILELHKFEIKVKSEPSKGTSFLISIPVNHTTQI